MDRERGVAHASDPRATRSAAHLERRGARAARVREREPAANEQEAADRRRGAEDLADRRTRGHEAQAIDRAAEQDNAEHEAVDGEEVRASHRRS